MKNRAVILTILVWQSVLLHAQWHYEGSPEMGTPVDISAKGDTTWMCSMSSLFFATGTDFVWQETPVHPDVLMIQDIEHVSGTIYLAALTSVDHYNVSFFRSYDLGQSWQDISPYETFRNTLPTIIALGDTLLLFDFDSVSISFDRGISYAVYPGKFREITYHEGFLYNIDFITYRSSDLGIYWEPLFFDPGFTTKDLASINGSLYKVDYATSGSNDSSYVYRSEDDGDTWTHLVTVDDYSYPKLIGDEHGIYLTNEFQDNHIWYSTDDITWIKKSNPKQSYDPEIVDGVLLFKHYSGLFATDSQVENIHPANEGFASGSITSFAHFHDQVWVNSNLKTFSDDPASEKWDDVPGFYSVAAREDGTLVGAKDASLYRSPDGGNTWIKILPDNFDINQVPNFHRLIAAGERFFALTNIYTWSSDNNGQTWAAFTPRIALVSFGGIYVAATKGSDVFTSLQGNVWVNSNHDLPQLSYESIYAIEIHKGYIFVFAGEGTFRLPPLTTTWEMVSTPASPSLIFPLVGDVVSTASNDEMIMAGVYGRGVFISKDNGDSWIEANDGLGNTFILSIEIIGDHIYVGTEKGIWRRPLADLQTVSTHVVEDNVGYIVSPVPSDDRVTICSKNNMELTETFIRLIDINGRHIPASFTVDGKSILLSIADLLPGCYIALIYDNGKSGVVKILKE